MSSIDNSMLQESQATGDCVEPLPNDFQSLTHEAAELLSDSAAVDNKRAKEMKEIYKQFQIFLNKKNNIFMKKNESKRITNDLKREIHSMKKINKKVDQKMAQVEAEINNLKLILGLSNFDLIAMRSCDSHKIKQDSHGFEKVVKELELEKQKNQALEKRVKNLEEKLTDVMKRMNQPNFKRKNNGLDRGSSESKSGRQSGFSDNRYFEQYDDKILQEVLPKKPHVQHNKSEKRKNKSNPSKLLNNIDSQKNRKSKHLRAPLFTTSDTKDIPTNAAKSYLEKAHEYLEKLQLSSDLLQQSEHFVQVETSGNPVNSSSSVYSYKLNDRLLEDKVEWVIRKRKPTSTEIMYHCGTFYTARPGYRVQLRAQIDRLHGDIYFSVKLMGGIFDEKLQWPCQQKFEIKLSEKMKTNNVESWFVPWKDQKWKHKLRKPLKKKDNIFSEWVGPFNISHYIDAKKLVFDVFLA